jgi:hypothetical protein
MWEVLATFMYLGRAARGLAIANAGCYLQCQQINHTASSSVIPRRIFFNDMPIPKRIRERCQRPVGRDCRLRLPTVRSPGSS